MAKYRLLSLEELNELEKEFVEYLVLNGITADDWVKMKSNDLERVQGIVDLFSDVVFESIMRKVKYLEYRDKKEIKTYHCLEDKLVLVALVALSDENADFTNPEYIQQAMQNPPESMKVYSTEKSYSQQREVELFHMTEAGCTIADGSLFKTLCLALPVNA